MKYFEIPQGSTEIQTGLWLYRYKRNENTYSQLFASEGYCFYDKSKDIYDENQNLLPRTYCTWVSLGLLASIEDYVSIPISEMPENGNIA